MTMKSEIHCPCCKRSITKEENLRFHLMTKHHRSELSSAVIELLQAQRAHIRDEEPTPVV